jgi:Fe2+ or Zn2+ uptake regulation protein
VLTQFEQAGILSRSHFESGKAVYELDEGQHHDHLVCLDCGKVEEFYDAEIERRQHAVAKSKGFAFRTTPEPIRDLHQGQMPQPPGFNASGCRRTGR